MLFIFLVALICGIIGAVSLIIWAPVAMAVSINEYPDLISMFVPVVAIVFVGFCWYVVNTIGPHLGP
jgi:type IV secretory pathway TrbL component